MTRHALLPLIGVLLLPGCLDFFDKSEPPERSAPVPLAKPAEPSQGAAPSEAARPTKVSSKRPEDPTDDAADSVERDDDDVAPGLPKRSARKRKGKPRKRYASTDADDDASTAASDAPQQQVASGEGLAVNRLVLSTSVSAREPVGAATSFASTQPRIYAFVEVNNPTGEDSQVSVSFYPKGKRPRGAIKMKVGQSRRWRTWASTRTATKPGTWYAVVRDADGKELARKRFEITRGQAAEPAAKK